LKQSGIQLDAMADKIFKVITSNGKDGILQSKLWKDLEIDSKNGSKLAIYLEKCSLIKREKILENGRWTFKLSSKTLPTDLHSIEEAPCLACPVEHMCSIDAIYSPNNCALIERWALTSFDISNKLQLASQNVQLHRFEDQPVPTPVIGIKNKKKQVRKTKLTTKHTPKNKLKRTKRN
jgi:hypothetical protein